MTAVRIALYQPDIPQNAGAILRLAACLNIPVDLIEPAGFVLHNQGVRRAGMDYLEQVNLSRHISWDAFEAGVTPPQRLILLSTKATERHIDFAYHRDDTLLVGRESDGVPESVHGRVDAQVRVPMQADARSLNVVTALALVLGEALRQQDGFPDQGCPA
ncbi:MAG: tRNA (cytidine(34)-2'-O)-methyltransferase [Rhodospirillaceae bacterium]|nr:tRNA (cytidine(34)-2'-O)-methyltransferase [Rhodospirillaceae bacterium]MBT3809629.1 tRNA (cytidine(34)-2'-O)-methyltransferase [Rhodospirillaceae bacterium]MBT3929564.1 tRNA (cytidine(34)-2'-O)-methyltransferase [Rhodospirillaceae bacterium]MBT4772961.1 tRNA (cytidine(34)-2'-O)-methyltransferase [Rhodospirillaceae bacterium]MBT5358327.1 tRNA (cytidine(34)-2'-O)-methyltransferase [Rhodospirillaceae bacterium]